MDFTYQWQCGLRQHPVDKRVWLGAAAGKLLGRITAWVDFSTEQKGEQKGTLPFVSGSMDCGSEPAMTAIFDAWG
ncbi:MAG: hypothetical protein COW02_17555 [Comamonadaceae bacterium CG12_big_fil_rev_8_21_14_0_65_59_15]|nr:MAG: hypothetical protein COW02_17555 [Comamonadaceae bacterium CG12_big_fil_rev_8_21_14_0_65_59_15]